MLSDIHKQFKLNTSQITHVVSNSRSNFIKAFRETGLKEISFTEEESSDEEAEHENLNNRITSKDTDSDNIDNCCNRSSIFHRNYGTWIECN